MILDQYRCLFVVKQALLWQVNYLSLFKYI